MAHYNVVELHFLHGHSAVTSATRPVRYHWVTTKQDIEIAATGSIRTGSFAVKHVKNVQVFPVLN
jgi:hypothetical protein